MLFLEKNPDLFPRPKFCLCKVRIHATEILQLKLMGNVAFVCISKNIPLNPYPVILYKIVGSPPPHLCKTRVKWLAFIQPQSRILGQDWVLKYVNSVLSPALVNRFHGSFQICVARWVFVYNNKECADYRKQCSAHIFAYNYLRQ